MPYAQFQGEKLRKSIACALAVFYPAKEPLSFKEKGFITDSVVCLLFSQPILLAVSREIERGRARRVIFD